MSINETLRPSRAKKVARWHGRVERPKCSRIRSLLCLVARLRLNPNTNLKQYKDDPKTRAVVGNRTP